MGQIKNGSRGNEWRGVRGDEIVSSSNSSLDSFSDSSDDESVEGKEQEERAKTRSNWANLAWKKKQQRGPGDEDEDDSPYSRFRFHNDNYYTKGHVSKHDGRLNISLINTRSTGYLAKALGTAKRKMAKFPEVLKKEYEHGAGAETDVQQSPLEAGTAAVTQQQQQQQQQQQPLRHTSIEVSERPPPRLNIVIMVIGSRGDVQPFLKIGRLLAQRHGHRVRIATHPAFRESVEQQHEELNRAWKAEGRGDPKKRGTIEFFSVGGSPSELMAFMVKNPGMIPTLSTVKSGDVGRRRAAMRDMFAGFWRACINATDGEEETSNVTLMRKQDPFVADAIIANPPSFAHIHCAEALGIPVHLMFTFPWSPTQAFPHPLARIRQKSSNVDPGYANFISYPLVEMMAWQGLGDLVNEFRTKTLGLDPVSTLWAPGATYRLHVPFTYLWSPALVSKPADWGEEIDVAGYVFLDLASSFSPPEPLARFLEAEEEPPVYIGFGSIVVDDADRFTEMIFQAVKLSGVRALVSRGWGGLGGDGLDVPPEVFLLENTPHDWLFPRVQACVIHGGAGTTAIALKCGKPTMIVPFFGDQYFWGTMVGEAGAGPSPVPYKRLTAEKLAIGIRYLLTDEAKKAARRIAHDIEKEGDGADNVCHAFHKALVLRGKRSMRCSILPDKVAVWQMKGTDLRLSPIAAELLVKKGFVSWKKLRLLRHNEWNDFEGPGEPLTGVAGSLMTSVGNVFSGIGGVPYKVAKTTKKRREEREKRKHTHRKTQVETTTTHAIDHGRSSSTDMGTAEDVARQVGRGVYKTISAIARTPVDASLALAQGFHNAPRLYGDDTVRTPTRVTGIKSGLKAAGREFAYGIYDGWTGIVRLPVQGAREGGVRGLVSGVGKGLTGFVLKDIAALIGPVGFTLQGVVKQIDRRRQPWKYIRRARIVQGYRELAALDAEEGRRVEDVVAARWGLMKELWAVMMREERREQKGFRGSLRVSARKLRKDREWAAAFEDVETAKQALDALRKGDSLETVLKRCNEEANKPGDDMVNEGTSENQVFFLKKIRSPDVDSGHQDITSMDEEITGLEVQTKAEENPFSTATPTICGNKAQNRQTLQALELER